MLAKKIESLLLIPIHTYVITVSRFRSFHFTLKHSTTLVHVEWCNPSHSPQNTGHHFNHHHHHHSKANFTFLAFKNVFGCPRLLSGRNHIHATLDAISFLVHSLTLSLSFRFACYVTKSFPILAWYTFT